MADSGLDGSRTARELARRTVRGGCPSRAFGGVQTVQASSALQMRGAVYNLAIPNAIPNRVSRAVRRTPSLRGVGLLCCVLVALAMAAHAADWSGPERQLATKDCRSHGNGGDHADRGEPLIPGQTRQRDHPKRSAERAGKCRRRFACLAERLRSRRRPTRLR